MLVPIGFFGGANSPWLNYSVTSGTWVYGTQMSGGATEYAILANSSTSRQALLSSNGTSWTTVSEGTSQAWSKVIGNAAYAFFMSTSGTIHGFDPSNQSFYSKGSGVFSPLDITGNKTDSTSDFGYVAIANYNGTSWAYGMDSFGNSPGTIFNYNSSGADSALYSRIAGNEGRTGTNTITYVVASPNHNNFHTRVNNSSSTKGTMPHSGNTNKLVYFNNAGIFLAFASSSSTYSVSSGGTSWTSYSLPESGALNVIYTRQSSKIVIEFQSTGNTYSSTNGTTWTLKGKLATNSYGSDIGDIGFYYKSNYYITSTTSGVVNKALSAAI